MKHCTGIPFLAVLLLLVVARESVAQEDRSAIDDYYDLKARVKERFGLDVGFKESLIFQQRLGTALSDNNYNLNGQFDFHGSWSVFGGRGAFVWLYMHIHQLGGITTTAFGANVSVVITAICDQAGP